MRIFNSKGRSRRTEYIFDQIIFFLAIAIIVLAIEFVSDHNSKPIHETAKGFIFFLPFVLYIVLNIMSAIKRLHDLNNNGYQVLLFLIPIFNIIFWFSLVFRKGTPGDNNYGPDPRDDIEGTFIKSLNRNWIITALLILALWSLFEIDQNLDLKEVEAFISDPKENTYIIMETDEDPDYKYYLIKTSKITIDSCTLFYSDYAFSTTYDAKESLPSNQSNFNENFSYWGTFSKEFLKEIKIVEVLNSDPLFEN